jgi:hypothetical protein
MIPRLDSALRKLQSAAVLACALMCSHTLVLLLAGGQRPRFLHRSRLWQHRCNSCGCRPPLLLSAAVLSLCTLRRRCTSINWRARSRRSKSRRSLPGRAASRRDCLVPSITSRQRPLDLYVCVTGFCYRRCPLASMYSNWWSRSSFSWVAIVVYYSPVCSSHVSHHCLFRLFSLGVRVVCVILRCWCCCRLLFVVC